jgi:hypothetical protein
MAMEIYILACDRHKSVAGFTDFVVLACFVQQNLS